jgi:threonine synthase
LPDVARLIWSPALRCSGCDGALDTAPRTGQPQLQHADPTFRYASFLPVTDASFLLPDVCRETPCRPARGLAEVTGLTGLWLKDETGQPTGTTKDRMAAVVLSSFREFGVKEFAVCSTGNSSTALARAAAFGCGFRVHLFTGREWLSRHAYYEQEHVTLHVLDADFVNASAAARKFARDTGVHWEGGFFNWARRDGLKIAYLEAFDQMQVTPDVVIQAVSSGMGMVGAWKGVQEYLRAGRISHQPRMVMVQQASCAPMVSGWRKGRAALAADDLIARPQGIAKAILRGDAAATYPYVRRVALESGGTMCAVDADELRVARRLLARCEDVDVCYAGAAPLAAALRLHREGWLRADECVLLNLSGRERDPAARQ